MSKATAEIDEMIRLRATRVPSINQMRGWKAEIEEVLRDLRRLAVVQHVRMAEGGGTVPSGFSCKVCKGEWEQDAAEHHAETCPLHAPLG